MGRINSLCLTMIGVLLLTLQDHVDGFYSSSSSLAVGRRWGTYGTPLHASSLSSIDLSKLNRKELQGLAKENNIKANLKTTLILEALMALQSGRVADVDSMAHTKVDAEKKMKAPKKSSTGTGKGIMKKSLIPPYVENLDLLDEWVAIRNPNQEQISIAGWKISDNLRKHIYTFEEGTIIDPGSSIYLYCTAKNLDETKMKKPAVFWKNKDGSTRMANILNDEGDEMKLLDPSDKIVASIFKTPDQVYIQDIDLKDECITLSNPTRRDIFLENWVISDDERRNVLTLGKNAMVPAESSLYVYCCAKGKEESRIMHPFVFWLNNDGSKRMKNVLNDDGDKVILLAPDQQAIASFLKIESEKSDFYGYEDKYDLSNALNEQGLSEGITTEDKSGLRKLVTSYNDAPEEMKKRTNKDLVKKPKKEKAPVKAKAKAKKAPKVKPAVVNTNKPATTAQVKAVNPPRSYGIGTPRAKPPAVVNYIPGTPPPAPRSAAKATTNGPTTTSATRVEISKPPKSYGIGTPRAKPPTPVNYIPGTPPVVSLPAPAAVTEPSPSNPEKTPVARRQTSSSPWDPNIMVLVILSISYFFVFSSFVSFEFFSLFFIYISL